MIQLGFDTICRPNNACIQRVIYFFAANSVCVIGMRRLIYNTIIISIIYAFEHISRRMVLDVIIDILLCSRMII